MAITLEFGVIQSYIRDGYGIRPGAPPGEAVISMRVRVLLQRCLQKDPKQRLRDIGDARISLSGGCLGHCSE